MDQLLTAADPSSWRSVHLAGEAGRADDDDDARRRAAREAWRAKLRVADPVLRTHAAPGRTVTQVRRTPSHPLILLTRTRLPARPRLAAGSCIARSPQRPGRSMRAPRQANNALP